MEMLEKVLDDSGEIVVNGRVFRPVYKHLLDNMPQDLVSEMARRRLAELDAARTTQKRDKEDSAP